MSTNRGLEQRYSPIDGTPYLAVKGTPEYIPLNTEGPWQAVGYERATGYTEIRPATFTDWRDAKTEIIRLTLDQPGLTWRALPVRTYVNDL